MACGAYVYNSKFFFSPWLQGNPKLGVWIFCSVTATMTFRLIELFSSQLPFLCFPGSHSDVSLCKPAHVLVKAGFAYVREATAESPAPGGSTSPLRQRIAGRHGGAAFVKGEGCLPAPPTCPQVESVHLRGSECSLIFSYLVWLISTSW